MNRHTALELRFSPAERSAEAEQSEPPPPGRILLPDPDPLSLLRTSPQASDPLLLLPGAGIESTLVSFSSHAAREAFLQAPSPLLDLSNFPHTSHTPSRHL